MVPVRPVFSAVRRPLVLLASALAFLLFAFPVAPVAQDLPPTPDQQPDYSNDVPAHIAIVEGQATLERDGTISAAEENVPLLAGDRLRTDDGRIEILFADGSVLDVDRYAAIDLMSESLMRLRSGRVRLAIVRVTEALAYRIDAAGSTTTIRTAGEFRLSVLSPKSAEPTLELAVLQGTADLSTDSGRTTVRAGMRAYASERTEPSRPEAFNSTAQTDFDRWCEEQRDARLGAVSTQYLPSELRYYSGAFDDAGDWRYEQSYGYVWYPRVAPTWQPYYYGNWSVVGSFGWFWVGGGRWCWPTHHYGYWGFNNGWYWIPGRHWAPAWVSWGYAPGYVSWCPLGYNGVPVVVAGAHFTRGWTTIPARTFTAGVAVPRHAVARPANANFAVRRTAPALASAGVRSQARVEPLRSPTGRRAGIGGTGTDVRGSVDSPRAVSRTGSLNSSSSRSTSTSVPSSPRTSRGAEPVSPSRSESVGRAVSRSRAPVTPNGSDQSPTVQSPTVRTPDNSARSRVWSNSQPPSDPAPGSSPRSRVVAPPSRSPEPPQSSSPGSRRASPPSRGSSDSSAQPGPPPSSRAMPRGTPPAPPPPSGPRPSGPPPSASPRSRGGSVQSGPPPSSSAPPSASAPRGGSGSAPRSGSSSSSGPSRGGGASPRTGRGGGR